MTTTPIEIDGSQGEGGGQILRSSIALSLLTKKPFRLHNIRAGRSKPGLQPQHLASVRAAAAIGQAKLKGAALGSTELDFEPGAIKAGPYRFDIGTAGATSLLLHTIYLPLALGGQGPSEITVTGGTHVTTSPSFHFLDLTWRRYLARIGLNLTLTQVRPGFYPRGGGMVVMHVEPAARLTGLVLREREPIKISGFSAVAGLSDDIARRQARRAIYLLEKATALDCPIEIERWEGGPASVLGIVMQAGPVTSLFVGLGARGKPAETVAEEAVEEALAYWKAENAPVDAHSADQLVLPLALAEGSSELHIAEVTPHLLTNIDVIRRFLDRDISCDVGTKMVRIV